MQGRGWIDGSVTTLISIALPICYVITVYLLTTRTKGALEAGLGDRKAFDMDTVMVGSRPTESVLTNSSGRRRSSRAEAKAAVRSLVEWAGDDPDREDPGPRGKSSCP